MASDGEFHEIEQGETTVGLAFDRGLFWEDVWNHPNNSQLRGLRKHPNILQPGDKLFLPKLRVSEFDRPTDQTHLFVLKGETAKFNMQFLDLDGTPFANEPYILTVDSKRMTGNLDGQGWVRVPVPANSQSGHILVGKDGVLASCDLSFGYLDPLTDLTGIQARLQNLGYFGGEIDGADSEDLQTAVREFRKDENLSDDGAIDDDLRARLEKRHYS